MTMQRSNMSPTRTAKQAELDMLCKECESLDPDLRNIMIMEKAAKILEAFRATTRNAAEITPANALTAIMMNATVAGGVHRTKNMKIVAPYLDKIFGGDHEFNAIRMTYMNSGAQGLAQLSRYVADILNIVHAHDTALELEILSLCVLIMSSNNHVSPKEKRYLEQLFGFLKI